MRSACALRNVVAALSIALVGIAAGPLPVADAQSSVRIPATPAVEARPVVNQGDRIWIGAGFGDAGCTVAYVDKRGNRAMTAGHCVTERPDDACAVRLHHRRRQSRRVGGAHALSAGSAR